MAVSYHLLGPDTWREQIARCEIRETPPRHETIEGGYVVPTAPRMHSLVMKPDGEIVINSLTTRYEDPRQSTLPATERAAIVNNAENRDGVSCVFLGPLFRHFGHFLLESLSRTWYAPDPNTMYAFATGGNVTVRAYMRALWKHAGLDVSRLLFLTKPTRFGRVIAPEPSFRIGRYASVALRDVYRRIAQSADPVRTRPTDRIYLSRSKWESTDNEHELESALAARGFKIVHLQDVSLEEQITTVGRAQHIVGRWGSAMHNVVFAQPGIRITHLFANRFFPSFYLTDQLAEADATYVLAEPGSPDRHGPPGDRQNKTGKITIKIDEVLSAVA